MSQTVLPPHNESAERATLGSMLLDPNAIGEVYGLVNPEDFYHIKHRLIYTALRQLWLADTPTDIVTTADALRALGRARGDDIDAAEMYLTGLLNDVPTAANARGYAAIVSEYATRRRLIDAAMRVANLAYDDSAELDAVIEGAQSVIHEATTTDDRRDLHHVKRAISDWLDAVARARTNPQELAGLSTGLMDYDRLVGGLRKQDLIILAGATSMGKTALLLSMVNHLAIRGQGGALFSLEMSEQQILTRLAAMRAGVTWRAIQTGQLTDEQMTTIYGEMGKLASAPLFVDDQPAQAVAVIRAKARKLAIQHDIAWIAVDFLQLVDVPEARGNAYIQASEAARGLKNLAKELDIPVLALSQISRAAANRADKRPGMSDLRDSGKIEEAADVITFVYRPEYYDDAADGGVAELLTEKNRTGGNTGAVSVQWQANIGLFRDLAKV